MRAADCKNITVGVAVKSAANVKHFIGRPITKRHKHNHKRESDFINYGCLTGRFAVTICGLIGWKDSIG